ncbi:protein of unknown function [Azospirillum lipoferum 4B]|uniref:Uncharacterized protein n=1 Tax=Azospirillum lipoferum (strain 4B) TaxID=862719 RepID=G7Z3I9_AZOL4|nr:protein of unknown function [Azospirillum lipoferum 4B]
MAPGFANGPATSTRLPGRLRSTGVWHARPDFCAVHNSPIDSGPGFPYILLMLQCSISRAPALPGSEGFNPLRTRSPHRRGRAVDP